MATDMRRDLNAPSPAPDGDEAVTLIELLRMRAMERPDQMAYTFLVDGEEEGPNISYEMLDRKARAIAAALARRGEGGERALLLYPSGLEFIAAFFGCLYAGVIAVPANPPQSNKQAPRLQAILSDAQARHVLTCRTLKPRIERSFIKADQSGTIDPLITDEVELSLADEWNAPTVTAETPAYLQYTSGSISTPKGVIVSHGNVLHNLACIDHVLEHTADSVLVTWLPHFHDMGLLYGVLEPVFKGFPGYLMPPASFVQRPYSWLRAIHRYRATHSAAPNFAYDHCVRKIKPGQLAELDLSRWTVAVNGAEPIRKETLERFIAQFEGCGFQRRAFCPAYGLAEASLMVTSTSKAKGPVYCNVRSSALKAHQILEGGAGEQGVQTFVSSGHSTAGTNVVIVDPESLIKCQPGRVGEVWVSGKSIARGYWNRREETERTFRAYPAGSDEGPFLRTGDLGFLKDGELFITGRIKSLIIIAGRNHYPQDIERTVEISHPAIRPDCSAAFSIEVEGEERLAVAAEIDHRRGASGRMESAGHRPLEAGEVRRAVCQAVATQHEAQPHVVLLLKAGTIPKTSSGKIQRLACRSSFQAGTLQLWEAPLLKSDG